MTAARRFQVDLEPMPTLRRIDAACAELPAFRTPIPRSSPTRPELPKRRRRAKQKGMTLGIKRLEAIHYYVHDLERSRRFYTELLDFAEVGASTPELETRGPAALRGLPAPATCAVVCSAARRRGRARLALPPQAPRRRRHARLRGRGHRPDVPAARRARRHAHQRRRSASRTTAARSRCSRSPRRSATRPSASSSGAATATLFPGFVPHDAPRGGKQRASASAEFDHVTVELPDHEAGAALDGARARLRAVLGGRVPHQRRDRRRRAAHGSGLQVDRHVGSRTRA